MKFWNNHRLVGLLRALLFGSGWSANVNKYDGALQSMQDIRVTVQGAGRRAE